ncbi:MAG: alpha/beta hydrolase [Candidatus Hydrogenedentales bacterium]
MFRHDFAEVNGVRLHYASAGSGPLMLFVHGFPEFWYAWRRQLAEFGRDHLAVAPDTRGFNLSGKPEGVDQYHVKHLIADLRALARHLGHEKFVLVAHDWGGATAWAFAIAHPECVEKLVIINAPHPAIFARELANNRAQQEASPYMRFFRTPEAEKKLSRDNFAMLEKFAFGLGKGKSLFDDETLRLYREAWSQPGALTGGLNYYRASPLEPPLPGGTLDLSRLVPERFRVKVPTLVIWGERDKALLTGNLDGLEEFVSDLTVHRIPDASHWVVHERSDEVNRLIREFLAG